MHIHALLFRIALVLLVLSSHGWADSSPAYNTDKNVMIYGQVESVNNLKSPTSGNYELYLFIRRIPSGQPYFIHLAPQWYVKSYPQQFLFEPGDRLAILGALFATQLTSNNIAAATVINYSKDSRTLSLRNPSTGSPVWNKQLAALPSMAQKEEKPANLPNVAQTPSVQQPAVPTTLPTTQFWNNQAIHPRLPNVAQTPTFQQPAVPTTTTQFWNNQAIHPRLPNVAQTPSVQQPVANQNPVYNSNGKSILIYSQVESVNTIKSPMWGNYGYHLFVRQLASGEMYFIHVAPQWYANNHPEKFNFAPGDLVAILGTLFTTQLTPNNIQAATIINYSKNFNTLYLRNPTTGAILWNNQPKNLSNMIQNTQQLGLLQTTQELSHTMQERARSASDQVQVQFLPSLWPTLNQTIPQP